MNRYLFLGLCCLLCSSSLYGQRADPSRFSRQIDTVDLKSVITRLASPAMMGRKTGEEGQKKAARYIASRFKELGLKPVLTDDYFQSFNLIKSSPDSHFLSINDQTLKYGEDYFFDGEMDMSAVRKLDLVVLDKEVPVGNGLKGKAVAVPKGGDVVPAAIKLRGSGVSLIVHLLSDEQMAEIARRSKPLERAAFIHPVGRKARQAGSFHVRKSVFEALVKSSTDQKKTVSLSYQIERKKKRIITENVMGLVEGKQKDKVLVISAHYDHEGVQDDVIFYGADDNASGTAAMMEMAEAFAKANDAGAVPKVSMLFVAFTAEEDALLGSYHYILNPPFPVTDHVANLNMDMIGRVAPEYADFEDYVYLLGTDRNVALKNISEKVNKAHVGLELDYSLDGQGLFQRSDQWPFAQKGLPALFYFNGVHDDYSQPTDTVDKINFPLLRKRALLIFHTAWEIAFNPGVLKGD